MSIRNKFFLILCGVMLIGAPLAMHAQSADEITAEIASLMELIKTLETQIAQSGGTPTQTTSPQTAPMSYIPPITYSPPVDYLGIVGAVLEYTCANLSRTIRRGMNDAQTGGQVSILQQFLTESGDYSYPEITGFFGAVTESAVKRFQARINVVSSGLPDTTGYGAIGPRTRNLISSLSCSSRPTPPSYPTYPTYPIPPYAPTYPTPPQNTQQSCIVNGITVAHGTSIQMYSQSFLPVGVNCSQYVQARYCTNSVLSGDTAYQYSTCTAAPTQPCLIGGVQLQHGESRTFYSQSSAPTGQSCDPYGQSRTCTNGILSGSASYPYLSCNVQVGNRCNVAGVEMQHGETRVFYNRTIVGYNEQCSTYSQSRVCTNGTVSGGTDYDKTSCSAATSATCILNGITVSNNQSRDFYDTSVAPYGTSCTDRRLSRLCVNGVLQGSTNYQYSSCTIGSPTSCNLDGVSVTHNLSRTFYSTSTAPYGSSCTSYAQTRTCNNGAFSGNASFDKAFCSVGGPQSCTLDDVTVAHGTSRTFYSTNSVSYGGNCSTVAQTRTCSNGVLSGSSTYNRAGCSVSTPAQCTLDGVTVDHGATRAFYFAQYVAPNEICASYQTNRTCNNGTFSGNTAYKYATCQPVAQDACALDNVQIPNGSTVAFYSVSTAPAGQLCTAYKQDRTCTSGVLSGSSTYNRSACSDAASCTRDGVVVAHGASALFYTSRTVAFGNTCASVSQSRTCTNGVLGGGATYQYGSCSVNPPTSAAYQAQLASVLKAVQEIISMLVSLKASN